MDVVKKKRGLVLGGGGARGMYEIGAWIAFQSCGIHFDVVSGTSIGALVGAMYTQQSLKLLLEFVYHLSPEQIVTDMVDPIYDWQDVVKNKQELFDLFKSYVRDGLDVSPLRSEIERMFDWDAFMASNIDFACMTYSVDAHRGVPFYKEDFTRENAVDILMASASCFPAFPMAQIEGKTYIDGGYADNLPVSLALDMGAEEVYVVDVHGIGLVRFVDSDCKQFRFEPLLPMGHVLDFSQKNGVRTLEMGYFETMKFLGEYCGYMYSFDVQDWSEMYMVEQYLKLKFIEKDVDVIANLMDSVFGYRVANLNNRFSSDYFFGKWVECLAWICELDAVRLWRYDEFLRVLNVKLSQKKGDTLSQFYHILVRNQGVYPLYVEAIKSLHLTSYYLAYVWYFLSVYLKRA